MGGPAAEGGDTTTFPTPADKGKVHRWAPIKKARAAGKPLSPLGPTRAPRSLSTLIYACPLGKQAGMAGLACNGDQMGHGPWGQGWQVQRRLQ